MQVKRCADVAVEVPEGTQGVKMRWLIGAKDGAPNFAMRQFEVAPGGATPHHRHDWEHEVYVLGGRGEVIDAAGAGHSLAAGDCVLVPGGELHQFRADAAEPLLFLCMVPHPDRACCDSNDPNCCKK